MVNRPDPSSLLRRRWLWFLPLLAAAVPLWMAWNWSLIIPHADHWAVVTQPWLRWLDGEPITRLIHEQTNDSRHDAPKAIHFLLAKLTHLDLRHEALVCVLLGIGSAACTIALLRRLQPGGAAGAFVIAVLYTLLWFTPDQTMNWLFGVQICYMLVVLLTLAVITIFQTEWPLMTRTLVAMACAFVASHTFVNGWFTWPLGLACLLWAAWDARFRDRRVWIATALWIMGLAVTAALYFRGYQADVGSQSHTPMLERLLAAPLTFVEFFLIMIGMPLTRGWPTWTHPEALAFLGRFAPWTGLLTLMLFCGVLTAGLRGAWKGRGAKIWPWLLIAGWGLVNMAAVTLSRAGLGTSSPFQNRYLAFTLWFHLALLALLFTLDGRFWKAVRRGWLVVVVIGYIIGFGCGMSLGLFDHNRYRTLAATVSLRHAAPEPTFLDFVHPGCGPPLIGYLDKLDAAGFLRVPTIQSDLVSEARLDTSGAVIGEIKTPRLDNGVPSITCWAVNKDTRDVVDAVVISVQPEGQPERWFGIAQHRLLNPKVAERHRIITPDDRVGWGYVYGKGTENAFFAEGPNPFKPKPLPHGKVIFRAYAFDARTGLFTPLEGSFATELP